MQWEQLFNLTIINDSRLLNAVLIFFIGFMISLWVRGVIHLVLSRIRFNNALERIGWVSLFKKIDVKLDVTSLISFIIQLFFIIVSLMVFTEMMGLVVFSGLVEKIVLYYPNIFISLLIYIGSIYLIDFAQKIVIGTRTFGRITYSRILGKTVDWSIRILAALAICYQLAIVP